MSDNKHPYAVNSLVFFTDSMVRVQETVRTVRKIGRVKCNASLYEYTLVPGNYVLKLDIDSGLPPGVDIKQLLNDKCHLQPYSFVSGHLQGTEKVKTVDLPSIRINRSKLSGGFFAPHGVIIL